MNFLTVLFNLCALLKEPVEQVSTDHLKMARNLKAIDNKKYLAASDDPNFFVCQGWLPVQLKKGRYKFKLLIELANRKQDGADGHAAFFFNTGTGFTPTPWVFPYKSGTALIAQIELLADAWVRFDPVEYQASFKLLTFELTPIALTDEDVITPPIPAETHSYGRWIAEVEPEIQRTVLAHSPTPTLPLLTVLHTKAEAVDVDDLRSQLKSVLTPYVCISSPLEQLANGAIPKASAWLAQRPGEFELVYVDHDHLDHHQFRTEPFFKPDWSPTLYKELDYVGPWVIYRTDLLTRLLDRHAASPVSMDRRSLIRLAIDEISSRQLGHIPLVLIHLKEKHSNKALENSTYELNDPSMQISASNPEVSLLIPTRDGLPHLKNCIDSFARHSNHRQLEIIIINNQTSDPASLKYLKNINQTTISGTNIQVKVIEFNHPFNFSKMNNIAAQMAAAPILACINDDIEAIDSRWLDEVVNQLKSPRLGALGGLLQYPNGTVQHAGIVLGVGGLASHIFKHSPIESTQYFDLLHKRREVSAVTGAALFVRKQVYFDVGGMDAEHLPVAYNDIDLCLKINKFNLTNIYSPKIQFIHHESISRGSDVSPDKYQRLQNDTSVMFNRWGSKLLVDPYYNINLSHSREDLSLDNFDRVKVGLSGATNIIVKT